MRLPLPAATAFVLSAFVLASCSRPAGPSQTAAATPAPATPGPATPTTASADAVSPPPTASFKFATQTLTVPAGFTIELVAGPPLVNRPISIAFDEKGRLYATDSSGFSERADKQLAEKPHRIVRLEDRDGDGRFEHSTVFAEKMMFPQGALFRDGSLYVAAPPHIWKLTDTNDDGVSDHREIWYDGKTLTGCANDLHGPYLGPDGWMYWTKGAFAEQQHTLPSGKPLVTRAAHIFRSRLDGKGEEPVLTGGMDNPVGVTFTATGERILCGTFFQVGTPGKRDGLIHAIYGGVYGKDQPAIVGHTRTGDLMPIMTHMGAAAPCGITTYRSRVFGADYHDNLFVCYFNLRKIARHELIAEGATFRTRDTDFVTSDAQDFHPTDVLEDADGSLLVVDTGGWYKICCPTSALAKPDVLGGIYRIRKTGAAAPPDPRGLEIRWDSLSAAWLVGYLGDDRPYVRERALERLAAFGADAVPALADTIKPRHQPAAEDAVWALMRIDSPAAREATRRILETGTASVVRVALQAVSLWRDPAAAPVLRRIVAGSDMMHARLAAEALGRIGDAGAIDALFAATKHLRGDAFTATGTPPDPAERIFEHALTYALIEMGRPAPLLAQLKSSRDPRVLRVAMLALNQMPESGLKAADVIAWLESADLRLKQTAGWIVGFHPEWGDALSDFFRRRLAAKTISATEQAGLETQLAQLAASTAIQDLLATTVKDRAAEPASRRLALRAMAAARLRQTPARWLSDLAALLSSDRGSPEIVRDAVATARGLPLPKGGSAELAAALARTGRDANLPVDVRLDALAATSPAALGALEPELFQFARTHLDPEQPMLVRSAAATVLGKASLSPEQQLALAETLKNVGALDLPRLLPAFERKPNEELGRRLVAAMRASPALSSVRAGTVRSLFARYPQPVQHDAEELVRMINADSARQHARVDELLAAGGQGDVRRGQLVFNSTKAACTLCHMMGHLGGRLGPDLTRIGQIRSERELLEATIFPSATIVRGFEPYTVTTKGGAEHSGIIKKDTPEEVVLATGVDTEQRVARGDIREMKPAPTSPMPPGMDVVLTAQELADLVAFLKSRQ